MDFLADFWPYIAGVLITVVLPLVISGTRPLGAVRVIGWLKKKLKLEGDSARVLTLLVALGLAGLVALADGILNISGPMTPEKFNMILGVLLVGSQVWYSRIKAEIEPVPEPEEPASE